MMIREWLTGEIQHNDGELAEIQTVGTEGVEKDLILDTIQVHRSERIDTPERFQQRFPVGMCLDIRKTVEFVPHKALDAEPNSPL